MTAAVVAVVVNGALVDGSVGATLRDGVVAGPLSPYLRDVASSIEPLDGGTRIRVARGPSAVVVTLGSTLLRTPAGTRRLGFAPFERDGSPIVPLGEIARALGARVGFDRTSETVTIATEPAPLATLTPDPVVTAPFEPLATFTPNPSPAPRIVVTGSPRPRRTPIPVSTAPEAE